MLSGHVNDAAKPPVITASPREVVREADAVPRPGLATAAAVFYVVLWASAFVPSRVIAIGAPPLWTLTARFLATGALLVPTTRVARLRWPHDARSWGLAAVYGVLANTTYLALNYEALRHL